MQINGHRIVPPLSAYDLQALKVNYNFECITNTDKLGTTKERLDKSHNLRLLLKERENFLTPLFQNTNDYSNHS